jgi:enoyl-CoA hydratase/carnithine racemase
MAGAVDGSDLTVERRGRVAVVWFDRPDRLNAFRGRTFDELHQALDGLAADPDVHGIVLTGRGRAFCAGEDLNEAHGAAVAGFGLREARGELVRLQDLTRKLADFPRPVIAAINGAAVGLGAELPLACDIRLAAPAAYFSYPEAQRGLCPTNGCFHYLPPIVGLGRAVQWLVAPSRISADEALRAGLVGAIHPEHELVGSAVDLAAGLGG